MRYVCMALPDRWECGRCLRGIIVPKPGYKCKVCGARVVRVPEVPGALVSVQVER